MSNSKNTTQLFIRRFRFSEHIKPKGDLNILVVGPSDSRKNACIQRLIDATRPDVERLVIVTRFPEWYNEDTYDALKEPPHDILEQATYRVIEGVPQLSGRHLQYFDPDAASTTIASNDYPKGITEEDVRALDYVILFGGVKRLRSVWDDFGGLIHKYRDFAEIYKACTNEGDRYSDDFMVIKNKDKDTTDLNDIIFWGSLTREANEPIEVEVDRSLLLNIVRTAEEVELPKPREHKASIAHVDDNEDDNEDEVSSENSNSEREERADCCVM